ncbi:periplasmic heavy metal sensor [Pseudooceanicola sp. MF1-13]|uniref:periplasmic heavy metal sensor n=1 Tax=Pseudooceanicola sp. MF1-13 TaxID=3379095 RepID=UPI00389202EF
MTGNPQTSAPQGPASRKLGWLRWILLPSLALNLLVLGLIAGHVIFDEPDRRVPRVDRMGGPLTFALSHEDRREIGDALRREYRDARPSRAELQAQYQDVIAALRQDPYDRAAIEQAFADQLDGVTQRVAVGQKVLLDRIESMSADERSAFADRLEEGLKRPGRDFGRGDGPPKLPRP